MLQPFDTYQSTTVTAEAIHGSHVCCNFADENRVLLRVMEALVEALSLNKADAEVAYFVTGAIRNSSYVVT